MNKVVRKLNIIALILFILFILIELLIIYLTFDIDTEGNEFLKIFLIFAPLIIFLAASNKYIHILATDYIDKSENPRELYWIIKREWIGLDGLDLCFPINENAVFEEPSLIYKNKDIFETIYRKLFKLADNNEICTITKKEFIGWKMYGGKVSIPWTNINSYEISEKTRNTPIILKIHSSSSTYEFSIEKYNIDLTTFQEMLNFYYNSSKIK